MEASALNSNECNISSTSLQDVNKFVENIFLSDKVKGAFTTFYDEKLYNYIASDIKTRKYFPLTHAEAVIAVSKIIQDTLASENINCTTLDKFADNQVNNISPNKRKQMLTLQNHPYLDNYITARIDIKNMMKETNAIEIIEISDAYSKITIPKWFSDKGQGCVIESKAGALDIKFGECHLNNCADRFVNMKGSKKK